MSSLMSCRRRGLFVCYCTSPADTGRSPSMARPWTSSAICA